VTTCVPRKCSGRSAAIISSLISTRSAPTSRMTEARSGKMPTTSVRRLSLRLSRSMGCSTRSSASALPGTRCRPAGRPPWPAGVQRRSGRRASADRRRRVVGCGRCRGRIGRTLCAPARRSSLAGGGWRRRAGCAWRAPGSAATQRPESRPGPSARPRRSAPACSIRSTRASGQRATRPSRNSLHAGSRLPILHGARGSPTRATSTAPSSPRSATCRSAAWTP
jgi:hypothetical protein